MKIIILLACLVFVSANTMGGKILVNSPTLQNIFNCRGQPGDKCLENISSSTSNFFKAVEEACPKCSYEQKFKMASWLDAYHRGASIEEANKLFNPDGKYFDTAFINK